MLPCQSIKTTPVQKYYKERYSKAIDAVYAWNLKRDVLMKEKEENPILNPTKKKVKFELRLFRKEGFDWRVNGEQP